MKVFEETSISDFEAWSGAENTKQTIIDNNMENEFDALIEETYPDGIDKTALNDLLLFESDWIFESLGITEDTDDEEEEETEEEEEE